jgi:hypothetical protein
MSRARWVGLLVAFALLAPTSSAFAHGGNPNYRSVINEVTPKVPEVSFQVLNYDSYMQLLDQKGHEVTIYGYEKEPYARILANGNVQVNKRSPATYLNDNRFAEVTVPPIADPKAAPLWQTVDDSGTFVWHDHRMHYMSPDLPPQVKDKGTKTKIFDYAIPISVDGKRGDVDGTLFWVGSASTSKLPFLLAAVVIVVGGTALVLFVRRRRRDEDDDVGSGGGDGRGGERDVADASEPAGEAW